MATNQIYHVFNRGNARQPIFLTPRHFNHFIETTSFYRFSPQRISFSQYLRLPAEKKREYFTEAKLQTKELVETYCFCLMPNHYHLLLKQKEDNGISTFIRHIQNSYAKYFNIKEGRIGSLFQGRFRGVLVETDEQLMHLSRYIHLNPYTSYIVKSVEDLISYPWSSLSDYLGNSKHQFINKSIISQYPETDYKQLVLDQADYQRKLNDIKHLSIDA